MTTYDDCNPNESVSPSEFRRLPDEQAAALRTALAAALGDNELEEQAALVVIIPTANKTQLIDIAKQRESVLRDPKEIAKRQFSLKSEAGSVVQLTISDVNPVDKNCKTISSNGQSIYVHCG